MSSVPFCVPLCFLTWHLWMLICLTSVNKDVTPRRSTHFHLAIPYHACVQGWMCCLNLPVFSQLEFRGVPQWVLSFPTCRNRFASFLQNSAHFQIPWKDAGIRKRNTQYSANGQKRPLLHNTSRSGKLPHMEFDLFQGAIYLGKAVGGEERIDTVPQWFCKCGPLTSSMMSAGLESSLCHLPSCQDLGEFLYLWVPVSSAEKDNSSDCCNDFIWFEELCEALSIGPGTQKTRPNGDSNRDAVYC